MTKDIKLLVLIGDNYDQIDAEISVNVQRKFFKYLEEATEYVFSKMQSGDTVLFSPNIEWENYPLKSALEERLETTVFLENDANAAAWGEFCYGAAQDSSSMVMLTVGTGIGGALVDAGRLIIGGFGMAAELGHIIIEPDGRECGCGNKGCLEQYASGTALMREARINLDDPNLDRTQLIDLLVAGDSAAIASISERFGGGSGGVPPPLASVT